MRAEAHRQLPFDVELEQALLGTLMVSNETIDVVAGDIESRHFYDPLHQRMFDMIVALRAEGAVTPLVVHAMMKRDPGLQECGGLAYLANLCGAAPALPPVREYARMLRESSLLRGLVTIGEDITNAAYEADRSSRSIADDATERLLSMGRARVEVRQSVYDIALDTLKEVEAMAKNEIVAIVKTGIDKLDDELGGFRGGDLIVVAGKSGMGKSALMATVSHNTAFAGVPTLVFSYEMTRRQWVDRMVCDAAFRTGPKPLRYSQFRSGRVDEHEFSRFHTAAMAMQDWPFEIRDEDDLTIQQMISVARAFKARHKNKLGVVLIDYLQIIPAADVRGMNREQIVSANARGAKSMAKLLGWPVVAGSQMNEGADQRGKDEKRPQASDVRESKGIMNESDLILSPYRPAYFVENRKPTDALPGDPAWAVWRQELTACEHRFELLGLKNRHGRRFDVDLWCDMGANAIRSYAPAPPDDRQATLMELAEATR